MKILSLFVAILVLIAAAAWVAASSPFSASLHSKKQQKKPIIKRRTPATITNTPPLGWNSWNLYACGVNSTLLMKMADAMVSSGLADKGYIFVNSDDCWMMKDRNATTGTQIPNPEKFPEGWQPVTDYIHSKGLMSGLYTAKGPHTCQGYAASCDHEALDAKYYASVGIDYVKDDSCSTCLFSDDNQDYRRMWLGINQSGRPMFLSVEANPTNTLMTKGGIANSHRVGHDVKPFVDNMITLVDIGSNLWPFAHNGSASFSTTGQGFWNDLDMLEIGNGPDFVCSESPAALARCRVHFSYWTIMKAVLLLGNDLSTMDATTLGVVGNELAISVNQDPLGVQARRVSVQMPKNNSLITNVASSSNTPANFGVIRQCDDSIPTQKWKFIPTKNNQSITGMLQTVDADGNKLCLSRATYPGGFYSASTSCDPTDSHLIFDIIKVIGDEKNNKKEQEKSLIQPCTSSNEDICSFGVEWNSQLYASGPWPHTRYLAGSGVTGLFYFDVANVFSGNVGEGGWIRTVDNTTIQNDNLVGKVTHGGCFALDVVTLGMLEVWAGPLEDGKIAVLLSNRSPATDTITFDWQMIGASSANAQYTIQNVWEPSGGNDGKIFSNQMSVVVGTLDVSYLILTPQ